MLADAHHCITMAINDTASHGRPTQWRLFADHTLLARDDSGAA
ncbi:MAG: hypothetical protein AAF903_00880 [Pseudomonadota bacterium]